MSDKFNTLLHAEFKEWASCQIRKIAGCRRRECRERFPRHRRLAILTCITARASRTCRDACRDCWLTVSFEVGGGENVPGIPGACATRNFTYLVRGQWNDSRESSLCVNYEHHGEDETGNINSSPPSAAYMSHSTGLSLFQVTICRLFGTKTLHSWEQVSVKFEFEFYHFHTRKCIKTCHLPK